MSALSSVLSSTTFDIGEARARKGSGSAERVEGARQISVAEYRKLHERNRWDDELLGRAKEAAVRASEPRLKDLEDRVREEFGDFMDAAGRIGHAVPVGRQESYTASSRPDGIFNVDYTSSTGNFVEGLIRGAAVLGVEEALGEVLGWKDGSAAHLCVRGVVDGLTLEGALGPRPDVRVEQLPSSSDQLPAWLPSRSSPFGYLSRGVVSLDAEARPALFRPGAEPVVERQTSKDASIESVCRVLSLESGARLTCALYVEDFGPLAAMARSCHGLIWPQSGNPAGIVLRGSDRWSQDPKTGVASLDRRARALSNERVAMLLDSLDSAKPSTEVAIERWLDAMDERRGLTDSLIDLRIALESVYLRDLRGGAHRLALSGAWYLGSGPRDRQRVFAKLKGIYRLASKAVHAGRIEGNKVTCQELLDGVELCRLSIIQTLTDGEPASWDDVMLDVTSADG